MHVTGDLENLGQGTPDDQRYFVTVADERTILHFGSSYGGNALLGKIAHGLRQAAYDGWASRKFLAEQFMLHRDQGQGDRQALPRLRRLPERLGQDQPRDDAGARRAGRPLPRRVLRRRHRVAVGQPGRRPALRHEPGVRRLRRRQGHQREDQPDRAGVDRARAPARSSPTSPTTRTPRRSGGRARPSSRRPTSTGWRDWKGDADLRPRARATTTPWAHPNSRFTTTLANVPNVAADFEDPAGVPIDAHHLRRPHQRPRAADPRDHRPRRGRLRRPHPGRRGDVRRRGRRGQLRYDPMSMRPVHVLRRGRLRRALAEDHRRGDASSRSSRT